ncbi:ABC transporter ATP-binding protein [Zhenhengia yiwuensis]|jgi:branched-chain amino acid transport system ATP-binding protein|uniref:ABC transporter ATP-binding protein n=1 Tax=Zhenhengia yiwuensis TaxID=2763666 RepID=UPI001B5AC4AA|nr:ABC transporter ATP-binding protein [Zhenhengia yiwuensis]MBP3912240.1 ABC transporter ATP-binding protein [Niameybacter sp.]MDY3367719.1 ABC transporter ATP-binding protein [Zhenhengia yiwuensis]
MLKVEKLNVYYGNIHALKEISFEVQKGEIVTLIGANGAGKTSTLQAISGMIKASSGAITLKGKPITHEEAHKLVPLGMAHVPEGRRVFAQMSVEENLELGAYTIKDKKQIASDIEKMYKRFPRLRERRKQLAGTMSGGEQQMLAMARALMSRPEIILMDEPSMGLAPILVHEIFEIIKEINADGTTVLLVEQNANRALQIAHRAYVLETGEIVLSGEGKDLLSNEQVKKAYLGA